MKIITSLSPNPAKARRQLYCLRSWRDNVNADIICMQTKKEIPKLKDFKDINFVEFKSEVPLIEDIVDYYNDNNIDLILNSDIELPPLAGIIERYLEDDGLLVIRKWNHKSGYLRPYQMEPWGLDGFAFHDKVNPFRKTKFRIGSPWWDYVLPWYYVQSELPIRYLHGLVAMHEDHVLNWSVNDYYCLEIEFVKAFDIEPKSVPNILDALASEICNKVIKNLQNVMFLDESIELDLTQIEDEMTTNGIIHIGANTGQERVSYADMDVIWVEALPNVYNQLLDNIKSYPRQKAYQALLTDKAGQEHMMKISNNEAASSSIFDFAKHKEIWPEVRMVDEIKLTSTTLDELLVNDDLSKYQTMLLDTQGSELLILKGATNVLQAMKHIICEAATFEAYKGGCTAGEVSAFLAQFGFFEAKRDLQAMHKDGGYYDIYYERN